MYRLILTLFLVLCLNIPPLFALERPGVEFKVFQFPANMIPRIDGSVDDWKMAPDEYRISMDQFLETSNKTPTDKNNLDLNVTVGWVKGMNRLYFLYEAYDNYWECDKPGLDGDIFEVVVDGDMSGGPLIPELRTDMKMNAWDGYLFHGVHAQNYHIFTPPLNKEWCMVWGCQPWISELPWANAAYSYSFRHGESGKLVLEFFITPFDYAAYDGPARSVESKLEENRIIGLSFTTLDHDGPDSNPKFGFWTISHKTTMYGNASELVAFRLMPLEKQFLKPVEADWTFKTVDLDRRIVAFKDRSRGTITSWLWDFGDGKTSTEQNPLHAYEKPGLRYVVTLSIEGPEGKARFARVWSVAVK
jgi:hypothetical protein